MRYSLAVLGLAAAVSATAVDAKVGVDANAQVAAGAAVGAKVGADVNAQVGPGAGNGAGAGVDAKVDADVAVGAKVDADVAVGAKASAGVDVNAKVNADVAAGANVDAQVAADVAVGVKAGAGAAAGVDIDTKVDAGAAAGVKVGAGVSADVDAQFANISAKYRGGAAVNPSIHAGRHRRRRRGLLLPRHHGFITKTQLVLCKLGLGSCQRDCVSFSGKGCAKHIDIGAPVGAQITGLINGVCILPPVILVVNQARVLVSVAVEHLLCVVGNVMKTLMATFDCHCK
ncbi:hypothetical protein NHJ13051_006666 [Beauveria bassiana]